MSNYRKKSSAWKGVAIFLAVVVTLGAAYVVPSEILNQWNPTKWGSNVEEIQPGDEELGGGIVSNVEEHGVSLASTKIAVADYSKYGVSPLTDSAFTLTATITPEEATYKDVSWTAKFENASSEWATGKSVTDYVTLPDTTALTNSLTIDQAFGEPIIVTVTSLDNPEAYATCKVDYVKRVTDFTLTWSNGSTDIVEESGNYSDLEIKSSMTFSDGTVEPTITYSASWSTYDLATKYQDVSTALTLVYYDCEHDSGLCLDLTYGTTIMTYDDEACRELLANENTISQVDLDNIIKMDCACKFSSLDTSIQNQVKSILYNNIQGNISVGSFSLTYKSTFNGDTYSSGSKSIVQSLDFSSISVPVSNMQLNQSHIYA